jgi:hypothetical protein
MCLLWLLSVLQVVVCTRGDGCLKSSVCRAGWVGLAENSSILKGSLCTTLVIIGQLSPLKQHAPRCDSLTCWV